MEKHLSTAARSTLSSRDDEASNAGGGGLLALMKKSREATCALSCPNSSTYEQWDSVNARTHLSLADVSFQTRHQKLRASASASQRGWRVVNGQKVYVTMRCVSLVSVFWPPHLLAYAAYNSYDCQSLLLCCSVALTAGGRAWYGLRAEKPSS